MAPTKLLDNMVVLVTGAGSGYGEGIAKLFAEEGAKVMILDINEDGAQRVVSEITKAGHSADFVRMDVTVEADWKKALSATKSKFGRVDILVNNAGWTYRRRDTLEVPEDEYDRVFSINVKSIYHSVKVVMPEFLAQGSGNIINISSCITCKPTNGLLWYTATKGAVDSITRGLAREYSPRGIRINGVSPSIGATGLTADFVGQDFTDDVMNFNAAETPLKRLCTPMDIAKAALYFATPYFNSFQTGILLRADGGQYVYADLTREFFKWNWKDSVSAVKSNKSSRVPPTLKGSATMEWKNYEEKKKEKNERLFGFNDDYDNILQSSYIKIY